MMVLVIIIYTPIITNAQVGCYDESLSIEKFFYKNNDGTMTFDENSARDAGFTSEYIKLVKNNVAIINYNIINNNAVLADDFSVTLYINGAKDNVKKLNAVRGQSKIVVQATGLVMVYMNTAEIDDLIHVLDINNDIYSLMGAVGFLSRAKTIVERACGLGAFVGYIQIKSYKAQIKQVRKNGTGIIMYVAPMPDGVNSSVWFGAQ